MQVAVFIEKQNLLRRKPETLLLSSAMQKQNGRLFFFRFQHHQFGTAYLVGFIVKQVLFVSLYFI